MKITFTIIHNKGDIQSISNTNLVWLERELLGPLECCFRDQQPPPPLWILWSLTMAGFSVKRFKSVYVVGSIEACSHICSWICAYSFYGLSLIWFDLYKCPFIPCLNQHLAAQFSSFTPTWQPYLFTEPITKRITLEFFDLSSENCSKPTLCWANS